MEYLSTISKTKHFEENCIPEKKGLTCSYKITNDTQLKLHRAACKKSSIIGMY